MNESRNAKWLDANEIKESLNIETVLSHYDVLEQMQRRGSTLRGLSPFREAPERTFSANLERNIWNDYPRPTVSGQVVKGNAIGLVMALEQCTFRRALEICSDLCDTSGRSITEKPLRPAIETRSRVERALAEPPASNEIFGRELSLKRDHPFLAERGLSPRRAKYWGIGWAPRGLLRGRIAVPIRDREGRVVAYTGRSLKEDDPDGKWRYPGGFHRSLELFNVDRIAADPESVAAVAKHGIIVVAGCLDAVWLWERGFKNVVALLGCEASEQQRHMLTDGALNPLRKVTIFLNATDTGRQGRKALCGALIYNAFVRYVDLARVDVGHRTDPDQFDRDELAVLLG